MPSIPERMCDAVEYNLRWQQWKMKTKETINQVQQWPSTVQAKNVQDVLRILCGCENTIVAHAETDVEALVAVIFYAHPLATTEELFKQTHQPTITTQLLQGDLFGALESCANLDWWLLTHFTDLLRLSPLHCNLVPALQFTGEEGQYIQARLWFALNYANWLLDYEATRKCAFDYMITCGDRGRTLLTESVARIPLEDKDALDTLWQYYEREGMKDAANKFYETLAVRTIEKRDFTAAIRYYCLSKNQTKIEHTFELALIDYIKSGQLLRLDCTKDEFSAYFHGERAQFFFNYSKMRDLYLADQHEEAAKILRQLLIAESSPLEFLPVVFLEGLCLLEDDTTWFSVHDIEQFKACLRDLDEIDAEEGYSVLEEYMIQRGYNSIADIYDVKSTFIDMVTLTLDRYPVS
ncbi:Nuclear pore complex protein Nup85 [Apophysomyces sp. BC1015]|nr:Nuclear pore complex protein Nup85 [Apophysomyces sp. BC1015]